MSTLEEHQGVLFELLQEFDRVCKKNDIKYMLFAGTALGAVRHQGFIPWDDDLDVALLRSEYDKLMKLDRTEWKDEYYFQREYSDHWPMHFSKLRKNNTTCLEKYHPKDVLTHQGVYMDVFPLDNASDIALIRRLQFWASKVVQAKSFGRRGYETKSVIKRCFIGGCKLLPLKPFLCLTRLTSCRKSKMLHSFLGGTSTYRKGIYPREWMQETTVVAFEKEHFPLPTQYDRMLTNMYGDYMLLPGMNERAIKKHALLVDVNRDYTEYQHYRDDMKFDVLTRSIR